MRGGEAGHLLADELHQLPSGAVRPERSSQLHQLPKRADVRVRLGLVLRLLRNRHNLRVVHLRRNPGLLRRRQRLEQLPKQRRLRVEAALPERARTDGVRLSLIYSSGTTDPTPQREVTFGGGFEEAGGFTEGQKALFLWGAV